MRTGHPPQPEQEPEVELPFAEHEGEQLDELGQQPTRHGRHQRHVVDQIVKHRRGLYEMPAPAAIPNSNDRDQGLAPMSLLFFGICGYFSACANPSPDRLHGYILKRIGSEIAETGQATAWLLHRRPGHRNADMPTASISTTSKTANGSVFSAVFTALPMPPKPPPPAAWPPCSGPGTKRAKSKAFWPPKRRRAPFQDRLIGPDSPFKSGFPKDSAVLPMSRKASKSLILRKVKYTKPQILMAFRRLKTVSESPITP